MPRFAFRIEYHGAPFCGWQRQSAQTSVQAAIEAALARLDPSHPTVSAAGRTDTGVHATGQVGHAELTRDWAPERLLEAVNHHLRPHPIAITACARVDEGFHARFSAIGRQYLFRLVSRRAPMVLERGLVWQVRQPLALKPMQEAAQALIGHHDFTTFRASLCQAASPVKTLDELTITEHPLAGGAEFRFTLRARSFLHNQVRSIVGTLERVGAGSWPPVRVAEALEARDRTACGPVSPPQGLYLTGVRYPNDPFSS
ncbi:MAG: tRNA pseudouridine(38-40) synthase TruA [Pararhodobacter sp.]|nr:tRNA pseudouridine(38-40) synthase TruA [Pararhodobacter sp.]